MIITTGYNAYDDPKTHTKEGRVGVFLCECGCGQTFFANYKTRHPRYANKTHRARAYRARARAMAWAMDMAGLDGYEDIHESYFYLFALEVETDKLRGKM